MIIRSEEIYNKAKSIVRSCGTRDTLKIARELGIYVHFIDDLNELLGMYMSPSRGNGHENTRKTGMNL